MAQYCSQCCSHKHNYQSQSNVVSQSAGSSLFNATVDNTINSQTVVISEKMAQLNVNQFEDQNGSPRAVDKIDAVPSSVNRGSESASMDDSIGYDVFIVGEEGDDLLYKFRDFLQLSVIHSDGRTLRVGLEEDFFPQTTDRLEVIELALKQSHSFFILYSSCTSSTPESSSFWQNFFRSQTLMNHIIARTNIVLVKETEGIIVNRLFERFVDFTLTRLFNGNSLRSCSDVSKIKKEDLNLREFERLELLCGNQKEVNNEQVNFSFRSGPTSVKGKIIEKAFHKLSEWIDPENGLLGSLFSREIVDIREVDLLRKELKSKSYIEVNEEVLRKIIGANDETIEAFIQCLLETNQKHVVDYLNTISLEQL